MNFTSSFPKINNTFGKLPRASSFKKPSALKLPKIKTLTKPKSLFTDFNSFATNNIGDIFKQTTKIGGYMVNNFLGLHKEATSTKLLARSAIRANRLGNILKHKGTAVSRDMFGQSLRKKQQAEKFITHAWANKGSRRGIDKLTFFRDQIAPGALKRIERIKKIGK